MSAVNNIFNKLERTISPERLDSYKQQGGPDHVALARYLWNISLCEALYPVLSILEVSYRNALHQAITTFAGPDWLKSEIGFLRPAECEKIKEAKESLTSRKKAITEGFLVSELSFGFWNSLLDKNYDKMWHRIVAQVVPNMPRTIRTRLELSARMSRVRHLRNQAFHHHSIWHWQDLDTQHADIHVLVGWICDSTGAMANKLDRFRNIHATGGAGFDATATDLLK